MAQQVQFGLEELKQHPEYSIFALALEERLRESEVRRRNGTLAALGFSVPVLISIGAGVTALAERSISSAVESAKAEISSQIPEAVRTELAFTISDEFKNSLILEVSDRTIEQARSSYEIAASIAQLSSVTSIIDQGISFSNIDARSAVSALENAIEKGGLESSATRDALISLGSKLANNFSAADRVDYLAQVTSALGTDVALTSTEVSVAVASSLGRKFVGSLEKASNWEKSELELFEAAVASLRFSPDLATEWQIAARFRQAKDLNDKGADEEIMALLSDVALFADKGSVGRTVVNLLLLTKPALVTRGGSENLDSRDFRIASIGEEMIIQYNSQVSKLLDSRQARDGARDLAKRVINANGDAGAAEALKGFLPALCALHESICSPVEDVSFSLAVQMFE